MNLGPTEVLIVLAVALGLVFLGLTIWALVDATTRPDWAWQAAGQNRTLWIVLLALALLFGLGFIIAVIYLMAVRPKVIAAQVTGPGPPGA